MFITQVQALLWKNYLYQKRFRTKSLVEFFLAPILTVLIFILFNFAYTLSIDEIYANKHFVLSGGEHLEA